MLTDKPSNTYLRAPGSTQGHAAIEHVMEHLAHKLEVDPLIFRMNNMVGRTEDKHPIREIMDKLMETSGFDKRKPEIEQFNKVMVMLIIINDHF